MRDLFSFLVSTESECSVMIRLEKIHQFWEKECREFSRLANYYRKAKRTKSHLQKEDQYMDSKQMEEINVQVLDKLDYIQSKEGLLLKS